MYNSRAYALGRFDETLLLHSEALGNLETHYCPMLFGIYTALCSKVVDYMLTWWRAY